MISRNFIRQPFNLLWVMLFLILMGFATGALAQNGKIQGEIMDAETGEPLIGANVIIQGTQKGAATNIDGEYLILNVEPGTYTLQARYVGYQTITVQEVVVRGGLTTERDFELRPESYEGEEVVVTAEKEVIQKDVTSSESRVSSEELDKMPVQEVSDVVSMQAGVNEVNGQIHIRGGRASEVSYIVDGIRVTDDFDRSQGLRVENQSIQELQVVSGTFSAEYGQAMSGIINIQTKSGSNEYKANVRGYSGGYLVNDGSLWDGLATNAGDMQPAGQYNLNASFSGPIIKDKVTFFASARKFHNDGWLYGYNAYSPHGPYQDTLAFGEVGSINEDQFFDQLAEYRTLYNEKVDLSSPWYSVDTVGVGGTDRFVLNDSGRRDSSLVKMNPYDSYSFQGNFKINAMRGLSFNLITNYGYETGKNYSHQNKLVPNGQPEWYRENYAVNLKTTITPSDRTYININTAYRSNSYESYLYEDLYDTRYFNYSNIEKYGGTNTGRQYQFNQLGTNNNHFYRTTESYIAKAEISSQVTDRHFVKAGVGITGDVIDYKNINLQPLANSTQITVPDNLPPEQAERVELGVPPLETSNHQEFQNKPVTIYSFIQDKIEYENLVINVGLRFDYFDPNARIPADPKDPDITTPLLSEHSQDSRQQREDYWWKEADPKYQLSPRLGVAYPITEGGVIYFSYGYFFQMPQYSYLYENSQVLLDQSSGIYGIFGNPDLDPEKSIQYELGLKQEITQTTALEFTGFYKDSRDYVSTGAIEATHNPSIRYATWINRDYANSKGVTLALNQVVGQGFSANVDYTFTVAEGSNSNPDAAFLQALEQGLTGEDDALTKFIQPLDWDRQHIVNAALYYTGPSYGGNIIANYRAGTPYTPSNPYTVRSGPTASTRDLTNTARKPSQFNVDLKVYKDFEIANTTFRAFFNAYNVLNNERVTNVYSDSGQPERPLIVPESAQQSYLNQPHFYSEPRRFQLGLELRL